MRIKKEILYLSILLLTSCRVGPNYIPPSQTAPLEWKNDPKKTIAIDYYDYWWEVFNDETLNQLQFQALENNKNLFAAFERVEQTRYVAAIQKAELYPQLVLNPVYNNQDSLIRVFNGVLPFQRVHQWLYSFPVRLNYEIDLWGRLRDLYESALLYWETQVQDYQNTMLILTSDLATAYFQMRMADTQVDLLVETIKTRQKALNITQARYEAKIVNYSDVSRAGLELTNAEAQYIDAIRERRIFENQIAMLVGEEASDFTLPHNPLKTLPPEIPSGIPSDVLLRRPDIARAERLMASDHMAAKAAYASFFPTLTLTGAYGYESPFLKQFLRKDSRLWRYGAESEQTLFDGGRKAYNYELQLRYFAEASYEYQQQILVAFQEVEDALVNIANYLQEYKKIVQSVKWAKTTYNIANDRYLSGVTFYLDVVDAERDELQVELLENNLLGLQYLSTVQLIKALGGGWGSVANDNCLTTTP